MNKEELDIIKEEEQALQRVLTILRKELDEQKNRFRAEEERSRELTAELVSTRRAEDRQLLASDEGVSHMLKERSGETVSTLEQMLQKPYFARLVYEEELPNGNMKSNEIFIGHHSNVAARIIDWKNSPIARLYYLYAEGDEFLEIILEKERSGSIAIRRQIGVEGGKLQKISGRFGEYLLKNGEWTVSEQRSARPLAASYDRLPEIMSLITPEQFRAISDEADAAVVLVGIAGSGKTTVALYRLAALIEQRPNEIRPEKCAVISRHPLAKLYIQNSLQQLGLDEVKVVEFSNWREQFAGRTPLHHLIIDEAQDCTSDELIELSKTVKNLKDLTIVGDRRQTLRDRRDNVIASLPGSHVVQFEVSHRSSLPIMKLASFIMNEEPPRHGRPGRTPTWFHCSSVVTAVRTAEQWLDRVLERVDREVIAVIAKDHARAVEAYENLSPLIDAPSVRLFDSTSPSLEPGVVFAPIGEVRGLEFRHTLLWDASAEAFGNNPVDRSTLYIGVTRAEEDICLITWQRPSSFLPGKDSPLVRRLDLG